MLIKKRYLGVDTHYFCNASNLFFALHQQVGDDEFGYMLADILKENNVNSDGMRFDPGARTALAFVTLKKNGEREFMFYRNPSADMLLQEAELDIDLIQKVWRYGFCWWSTYI